MYNEHIEAEKIRLAKMIEDDLQSIIRDLLNENKMGKNIYKRKCFECSEHYVNILLTKIQQIFTDSSIKAVLVQDDGPQKYVLLTVDWSA